MSLFYFILYDFRELMLVCIHLECKNVVVKEHMVCVCLFSFKLMCKIFVVLVFSCLIYLFHKWENLPKIPTEQSIFPQIFPPFLCSKTHLRHHFPFHSYNDNLSSDIILSITHFNFYKHTRDFISHHFYVFDVHHSELPITSYNVR